jgi:2-polyprenyl-3-methyl-5-hydroxy-6-metoxy-1,4-benzoquinol methylase
MEDADVETSSEAYARRFSGAVGGWFLAVQAEATLDLLRPFPRARIVDVGGGHGQLAAPLAGAGYDVTVVGSSEACRARVQPLVDGGQVRFQAADLLRLPFGERAFDVALAFRLLPHVGRWRELVAELCRVAARAVIVDYPTRRSVNAVAAPLFGVKKRVEGDTRPFAVFADDDVEAAFAAQGFRVADRRPEFAVPMALHRALRVAALSRGLERAARAAGVTSRLGSPVIVRADRLG